MFYYRDLVFEESEFVYPPSEDSLLLASCVNVRSNDIVLDLGCGSGLIGILAARQGAEVICADINSYALEITKKNAEKNGVYVETILSDLFENLNGYRFDKIFFNPPYVPCEEEVSDPVELSWNGGKDGNDLIRRFLKEFSDYLNPYGRAYIVLSSMNNPEKLFKEYSEIRFKEISHTHIFFEDLFVFEVSPSE